MIDDFFHKRRGSRWQVVKLRIWLTCHLPPATCNQQVDTFMKITLLSPYHGGSHKAWATGYQQHSQHAVSLLTLPDRFWKWRMHGGAVTLARRFRERKYKPDVILATDMLDVTTFRGATRDQTHDTPVRTIHARKSTDLPTAGR
ncbi:MAG: DUF3524 domain-containing protein [Anaerolineae bacterium]|nr:DUF3524 domain-containing protein [Anaerolineae bacterium]